jgi:hypothetical protein
MENKDISQIAFARIKGEGIKPISRNIFSIKRLLFWVVVFLSLIIGALTFALILSALINNDWDLYNRFGFNFILRTLPYFWFVSLVIFTILGEYYYRKTLLGHRRQFIVIMGVCMVSTIAFGSILYYIGVGDFIEKSVFENAPNYSNYILNRHEVWSHPKEGLLSGKIILIVDNQLTVIDPDNYIWIVKINNAIVEVPLKLEVGQRINILGDLIDVNVFNAEEIRPWM